MAKFKVGDKVRLKKTGQVGTITRVFTDWGLINYWVKGLPGGPTDSPLYAEDRLELANSRACNSVRGNTKLKDIDYWFADNGYGDDTLIMYVQSYKKDRCIDFVDRYADTYARDKFYDAMYKLTGIKNRWALNSRACNSSNPVVRKAMNDVRNNQGGYLRKAMAANGKYIGRFTTNGGSTYGSVESDNLKDCIRKVRKICEGETFKGNRGKVDVVKKDDQFHVLYEGTVKNAKAMNAVAMNAKSIDKWEFDIMLRSRMGDHGKGAEDYMRQNREQIEKDVGNDGFRKLCSKFGNTLAYNARNPIVCKDMNAVAMNAQTLDVGMKIVKWNGRKFVDGICESWEKGKRRITAKFNDGSVKSLFAKDLNVHADIFLPSQITQPKFQKGDSLHLTNRIPGTRRVIGGVVTSMYPRHDPSDGRMIWFYNLNSQIDGLSKGMWEDHLAKNCRSHTYITSTNPTVVNALTMNKEEWRTTDGGHKICIEDGVVTKGNPHVVSKMQGKKSAGSRSKSKTASTKGSSKVDDSKIKISSEYRDLEPVHARFMTLLDKDEEKAKDYWKRHKREIKRVDGGMSGDLAPDYPWMK